MIHREKSLTTSDELVEAALMEYFTRLDRGESVDLSQLVAAHPGCEVGLRRFLNQERTLQRAVVESPSVAASPENVAGRTLGDYRILRELGHGGMGVVYEAQQVSLGRRVALKVLPFAALVGKQQLARFRNEARAAATLDHPNIVAVHSVGSEGNVHYYAMQLIDGPSLAQVIGTMRLAKCPTLSPAENSLAEAALSTDNAQLTTDFPATDSEQRTSDTHPVTQLATLAAPVSSLPAFGSREFYRTIARLGIQAADALDHAHQNGVLHRDIKPGNLLLDAEGKLCVTDFGLARIEADAGMTMTGDIIGTLRYMAPEQALAKRVVVDHRADIYSLGATLYELLTLRPPFGETDRSELLKQIAFEEPRPLRKLDGRIPVELETVVLKAMAKNPEERYQTSQELADDLRAILEHRPIKAKPPTLLNRVSKWSRRNVAVVWATAAVFLLSTAVLLVAGIQITKWYREAETQRQLASQQSARATAERDSALRSELIANQNQYYADISSGRHDLTSGNFGRLNRKLLNHLPFEGARDRRGWEWYYLYALSHPETRRFVCRSFRLAASWSPTGNYVSAANRVWNAYTGEYISTPLPTSETILHNAWSPDGNQLAVATSASDSCIYVWDRRTDKVSLLRGHGNSVWYLAWSPDGKQLASGSIDSTVRVWDIAEKKVVQKFQVEANVTGLAWHNNGTFLAAGIQGTGVKVWQPSTGELIAEHPVRDWRDDFVSVSWHPQTNQLAVSTNRSWYVMNVPDGPDEHEHIFKAEPGRGIAWSPDGTKLAVAEGEVVAIWKPSDDQPLQTLRGHLRPINSVNWSPDSQSVLTSDAAEDVRIWNLDSKTQPSEFKCDVPIQMMAWDEDNHLADRGSKAFLRAVVYAAAAGNSERVTRFEIREV